MKMENCHVGNGALTVPVRYPIRKSNRLKNYDYSQPGYYFITICTCDRKLLLAEIVGDDALVVPTVIGSRVVECWQNIEKLNASFKLDAFCLMPNHLHGILRIEAEEPLVGTAGAQCPTVQPRGRIDKKGKTVSDVIRDFKSVTTRYYKKILLKQKNTLWQKSFYEHVIRNEQSLFEIRKYIEENPLKWQLDQYYSE